MSIDIIRAWKDDTYRQSLSEEQLSLLPANPAGEVELAESDLQFVYGSGDVGGFGANNFNRLQNSFTCSIQCSLDCNIQNIYETKPGPAPSLHLHLLGMSVLDLDSGSGASTAAPVTTSSEG